MVWFAVLAKVVGQQVGLEVLKTAGREIGKRLGKVELATPPRNNDDLHKRVKRLEAQLDERTRELSALAHAVSDFGERFERFIGRFLLLSIGSMALAVTAVVFELLL